MKVTFLVIALCGVFAVLFGVWGLNTPQGNRHFDEMDGLIPFFVGVAGTIVTFVAVLLLVLVFFVGKDK